jgi:hypothetical protein
MPRIFLAAVCKNIAPRLVLFQEFQKILKKNFPDLRIFVYENNSTDETSPRLQAWAKEDSSVHVTTEILSQKEILESGKARTWDNKPCRMEMIAAARNRVMESLEAAGCGLESEDILIWVDPDFPRLPPMDNLIHWIRQMPPGIHALLANGVTVNNGKYYDFFAYRDELVPFGDEILGEGDNLVLRKNQVMQTLDILSPPKKVMSGFAGLAIYRASCVRGLRYSGVPTADLNTVYRRFLTKHPQHPMSRLALQPSITHKEGALLGVYLFESKEEGGFWYRNNSGYNFPVVCEHVPFHASMIVRGFDQIVLMPSLVYYSDHFG